MRSISPRVLSRGLSLGWKPTLKSEGVVFRSLVSMAGCPAVAISAPANVVKRGKDLIVFEGGTNG